MEQTTINLRLPLELKEAFEAIAKARDLTSSQMIRHFMAHQVEIQKLREQKGSK